MITNRIWAYRYRVFDVEPRMPALVSAIDLWRRSAFAAGWTVMYKPRAYWRVNHGPFGTELIWQVEGWVRRTDA